MILMINKYLILSLIILALCIPTLAGTVSANATITVTEENNITAYCVGNCSNPENVLKTDGNFTRIYNDGKGANAVVVDLGKEISIANIGIKFYNQYSSNQYYNQGLGYFEDFASKPKNMAIYYSPSLPKKGIDYNISYDDQEQIMWIKTDTANSTEYIVAQVTLDSMIDISRNPLISYKLRVSDESVNSGFEYIDVSNGTNTIRIWGPDGQHNSTSWIERTFNAYNLAKSYPGYKYLKSYGLRLYNSSTGLKDNLIHFAYWDYIVVHDLDYRVFISSDNNSWELIDNNTISVKPFHVNILLSNITSENSNFSKARYIRIESIRKNIWINHISVTELPFLLISSSVKINHILVDNNSYILVTSDTGKATFIFKTPVFKTLRITDNTKVVINYDNGSISKNNGWKMYYNNSILTIEANLSKKHEYIMLEFNPAKERIKTGYYGACCNQFENQSDLNYFVNSNFDWIWYQTSGNVKTNYRHVKNLTIAGKKVILEANWWTNASLVGKTWDDLYKNKTLLNIAINNTIQQIEGVGKDYIYAVTFNSEEPSAGYDYAILPANKTNYIESNNKIYTAIKNRYPNLKIFAGVHVMQMSSDNLTKLSRDGIVDNWYMPDMNPFYNKLIQVRKNNEEIYVVIWASTLEKPELPPTVTQEAFELGISKGFTNIGFQSIVMKPPYSWIMTTDFFNESLLPYQRPELYKERMFEMVNRFSI